jgi:FKBP-type peptidyl-prolyl cis-trans isomerase FkpA
MKRCFLPILLVVFVVVGCAKPETDLERYKAQAAIDDKIVAKYITDNNLKDTAHRVSDTCGVYYIVINPGAGNDVFSSASQITVSYVGRQLGADTVFSRTDSSAFTPSYVLGQTILGWQLGIPEIKKGGEVRLLVPSRYAYGPYAQKQYGLPANAILDFDIRLYNITN